MAGLTPCPENVMSSTTLPARTSHRSLTRLGPWWVDAGLAAVLLLLLIALRPALPDGDAQSYADSAIYFRSEEAFRPSHLLYVPLLRLIYVSLLGLGWQAYAVEAFTALSNVSAVGVFILLARVIYPAYLPGPLLPRVAALGSMLSFGVLATCCAIETYALALLLLVALTAVCVRDGLATPRGCVAAGVLFVLAASVHITSILLGPFLLALLIYQVRRGARRAPACFIGSVLVCGAVAAVTLMAARGVWPGDPGWPAKLLPRADPEPPLRVTGRLGRAAYGMLRTIAYLPPFRSLTPGFATAYGFGWLAAGAITLFVARRGRRNGVGRDWRLGALLGLIVLPFVYMGVSYYPSDPERWLFLVPVVWLVVGLIWSNYDPPAGARLDPAEARYTFVVLVALLGFYNVAVGLWPDSRHDRTLTGLIALDERTTKGDLVIAPRNFGGIYEEFVLKRRYRSEFVPLDLLMSEHGADVAGCKEELRHILATAFAQGRRVFVFDLLDEGHTAGRGYPWAWMLKDGYEPDTFIDILKQFDPEPLVPPGEDSAGIFVLRPAREERKAP
jgi:hypothetical protein